MKSKCHFCNSDLIEGFIDSPKCSLRWHNTGAGFLEKYTVFGKFSMVVSNFLMICGKC